MPILTPDGQVWAEVEDWEERSVLASYWNAVHAYRDDYGDRDMQLHRLDEFEGMTVAGYPLETRPFEIEYMAARGDLDFEDIYEAGS